MSESVALPPLCDRDPLDRSVFREGRAKRAAKGTIRHDIFLEREGVEVLSVDRLDHAPDQDLAAISDRNAVARRLQFFGWAVVTVSEASRNGRYVRESAQLDNPFHADIHLNIVEAQERRDAEKAHANDLAARAIWRPRP